MDGWLLLAADDIFFAIDGITTSFTCNVENILKSLVIILYSTLYLFFFSLDIYSIEELRDSSEKSMLSSIQL